jgi:hypothetical protein
MKKVFQYAKSNLFGISIAIGFASFLVEDIFTHNNFKITAIILGSMFLLSAYFKYNESLEQRRKFKAYLRYDYKAKIISLIFFAYLTYLNRDEPIGFFYVSLFIVNLFRDYYSFDAKLAQIDMLKAKGLTADDLRNIQLVKSWEETRKGGIWKYCLKDGGVIAGAVLLFVVGIIYTSIFSTEFKVILASPGTMFSFIGYCYIAGAFIGVIIYRILWIYKEKRFKKLTDPLNILFESQKASLNDQA